MEKEEIIEEIKKLMVFSKDDSVEINPNYLQYFTLEELENIKDNLNKKRRNGSQINKIYLDEIYEKTKILS